MTSKTLTFSVRPRGKPVKKLPEELSLSSTGTSSDLYSQLAASSKTSIHRLRITKGSDGSLVPNTSSVSISDTGLRDGSSIYVKDLGPQISWRLVYLIEYTGPLLIHPLLYYYYTSSPSSPPNQPTTLQTLTCTLITLHFAKRILETLFIHRFSAATMPLFNLFKNSAHYWLLAGLAIAYSTYCPDPFYTTLSTKTPPQTTNTAPHKDTLPLLTYLSLTLYLLGETLNLSTHLSLRSLRPTPTSSKTRGIPHSLPFQYVTCPNYTFEALAWLGIVGVSRTLSSIVFLCVAVGQMGLWAQKREARYRREFGGAYKKKKSVMLPGIW
ncbi:MAG: hypothetical protein LQ350_003042 [Teloschistes chrysophthalmus]|nr:MAG: hypothetical protein LQ350_003042 [Niorma chrysophthalma]